jgi:hypothetical protein
MQVHDIDLLPDRKSARIVATVTAAVKLRSWWTFSADTNHTDGQTPSALSWIFLSRIVVYEHFSHRFLSDNTRQEASREREKLNRPYE